MQCPNCGAEVETDALKCPNCGVVLGIAAADALNRLTRAIPRAQKAEPPALETLVPRLGETLIEEGLITPEQLERALKYQQEQAAAGKRVLLGKALVTLGFVEQEDLDRAIANQIFKLQQSLKEINASLERQVAERTRELTKALERLRELSHAKDNFVDAISHELRTPLTQIMGYLDLCREETLGELTTEQKKAVDVMRRSAEQLHALIENLIRYSMLASGEARFKIEPLKVKRIVETTLTTTRHKAEEKGMHFEVQLAPQAADLYVMAEEEAIVWALQHLVDNAIKFNEAGGRVRLIVGLECRQMHFAICDDGSGIPPEKLYKVLEAFSQAEDTLTREHGGIGLGLALTAQILRAHNTFLEVHSEMGKGSFFGFALNIAALENPTYAAESSVCLKLTPEALPLL